MIACKKFKCKQEPCYRRENRAISLYDCIEFYSSTQGRIQEFGSGGDGERFAQAYNGVCGPSGVQGQSPWPEGQGAKLKDIHFFDALRRAKFGLLSRISR